MREVRVFCRTPLSGQSSVELPASAAHHIAQVLRMQAGQELTLFDGLGGEYPAVIDSATRNKLRVTTGEHRSIERESALHITLWHGLCRGERMDSVIQKATELGVRVIRPVITKRSTVKITANRVEKKLRHWRGVITSACEQSGRNQIPQIDAPLAFNDLLDSTGSFDQALLLHPGGGDSLVSRLSGLSERARILICTGPEGGFSEIELSAAAAAGMRRVHLGPRVLRTETAPLAALSIAQAIAGDLGAS